MRIKFLKMALLAYRGLIRMPKAASMNFPTGLPLYSLPAKIFRMNFAYIHCWNHLTNFPRIGTSDLRAKSSIFDCFHCTVYEKSSPIIARCLNTRYQCLNQREEETPDVEVAHIQKALEVENKLSRKQKRAASDPKNSMVNVGRFVPDKMLELIDEDGTSLGTVNRNQAIALSQEKKLKLVLLKPNAKPWPIYKLMTGQELHEEQVKRNEKAKKKIAPTQLKEIKASWNIGQHDIAVRQRQLENWFSNEHANIHARVTVSGGKGAETVPQEKQMAIVKQLLHGLEDRLTLNGPPQMVGKNMGNLRVTIRTMSAKEKTAYKKSLAEKGAPKNNL